MRTIVLQLIVCMADRSTAAAAGLQGCNTCFALDSCGLRERAGHTDSAVNILVCTTNCGKCRGSATSAVPFVSTSAPATQDVHTECMVALPLLVH